MHDTLLTLVTHGMSLQKHTAWSPQAKESESSPMLFNQKVGRWYTRRLSGGVRCSLVSLGIFDEGKVRRVAASSPIQDFFTDFSMSMLARWCHVGPRNRLALEGLRFCPRAGRKETHPSQCRIARVNGTHLSSLERVRWRSIILRG